MIFRFSLQDILETSGRPQTSAVTDHDRRRSLDRHDPDGRAGRTPAQRPVAKGKFENHRLPIPIRIRVPATRQIPHESFLPVISYAIGINIPKDRCLTQTILELLPDHGIGKRLACQVEGRFQRAVQGIENQNIPIGDPPIGLNIFGEGILKPGQIDILGRKIVAEFKPTIPVNAENLDPVTGGFTLKLIVNLLKVAKLAPAVSSGGRAKVVSGHLMPVIAGRDHRPGTG